MSETWYRDSFGFIKDVWITAWCVIGAFTFMGILILCFALDPANSSACDVRERSCRDNRTDTLQICDGRDLVIKSHVRGGYSVAVISNSPKCRLESGETR